MSIKIISDNRKARHNYTIFETYEAGISLKGTEVKSIREGKVSLKESFAIVEEEELFLRDCHINPYSHDNSQEYDPLRKRKLLLHRREIKKIISNTVEKGLTLIPLKVYLKNGRVKVEIAVAKGKKLFDKRDSLKKKSALREIEKAFKERNR